MTYFLCGNYRSVQSRTHLEAPQGSLSQSISPDLPPDLSNTPESGRSALPRFPPRPHIHSFCRRALHLMKYPRPDVLLFVCVHMKLPDHDMLWPNGVFRCRISKTPVKYSIRSADVRFHTRVQHDFCHISPKIPVHCQGGNAKAPSG